MAIQPLRGVRVVSLEQAAAAPLCARRLALAGAEVFKIERPEGDFARGYDAAVLGASSYFVWLNAGKKSVVLDLTQASGKLRLRQLLQQADVLIQNLKPGALDNLGFGLDDLHATYPALISVSISGFHPDGPGGNRKAYDLLMQAESGLADITGSPHAPGRVGVSVVDAATGMYAYEAVLEALLARGQTGRGERIDVALFDAVADLLAVPYLLERYTGEAPQRVGLAHPGICPYGVFRSACGTQFVLSIQNEREWQRLCEIGLERADLAADSRCIDNATRVVHRSFVDAAVQDVFDERAFGDIERALRAADLAFAPLHPLKHLREHPDFHTYDVMLDDTRVPLPRVPGIPRADGLAVPELGEHTKEVFAWLDALDSEED